MNARRIPVEPEMLARCRPIAAATPWNVIVPVPAHNEVDRIDDCMQSLFHAVHAAEGRLANACIVVVADKCSDTTADAARLAIERRNVRDPLLTTRVIEINNGNVGTARAIGVAFGQQMLGLVDRNRTWVANTDADTRVPETWLIDQLSWADKGVDAVAGVVTVDTFDDHPPIVAERFHATYTARLPDDSLDHEHVHGANLGVRLASYLEAGGWQQLELSEDHDLWNRMRAKGMMLRSPSSLRVVTSGRAVSRCPGGFADSLCAHRAFNTETLIEEHA